MGLSGVVHETGARLWRPQETPARLWACDLRHAMITIMALRPQALCNTVDTRSSIEYWVEYTGDLTYEFDMTVRSILHVRLDGLVSTVMALGGDGNSIGGRSCTNIRRRM